MPVARPASVLSLRIAYGLTLAVLVPTATNCVAAPGRALSSALPSAVVQPAASAPLPSESPVGGRAPAVLQVGTYLGRSGQFASIQAAVDAARPGDWVLIAPGDYHEQGGAQAGVSITTAGIHLRGMRRNGVLIDGTLAGSPPCSAEPAAQNPGPNGSGRDGIEVLRAGGVSVENLTVCNFLGAPSGARGRQVAWIGAPGVGQGSLGQYRAAYLTATSTFFRGGTPHAALYGIYAASAGGAGVIEHSYASNMADAGFHIAGCADCSAIVRYVHAQNSARGFSSAGGGGRLILENSEWDRNQAGIVPGAPANGGPLVPQDGACANQPGKSCAFIQYNYVHDNNNRATPAAGPAALGAVGVGIDLSGARNDTVQHNFVVNHGAWAILLSDHPDFTPPGGSTYCRGGTVSYQPPRPFDLLLGPVVPCHFASTGNRIEQNVFAGNGFFGNATNGDLAAATLPSSAGDCFAGNVELRLGTPASTPANLQEVAAAAVCGRPWRPDSTQVFALLEQVACASLGARSGACAGLPAPLYPAREAVRLLPLPNEAGMDNPCAGVPRNSWCGESR